MGQKLDSFSAPNHFPTVGATIHISSRHQHIGSVVKQTNRPLPSVWPTIDAFGVNKISPSGVDPPLTLGRLFVVQQVLHITYHRMEKKAITNELQQVVPLIINLQETYESLPLSSLDSHIKVELLLLPFCLFDCKNELGFQ